MAEDSQQSLTDFSGSADADDGGAEGRDTEAEIAEAVAGDNGDSDGGATAVVDMSERRYPDADGTTSLAVTQVDYTVEGRGDDERPVLHVFGRDADRESVHVRVHEFEPYFYAPLADFVTDEAAAEKAPTEWTTADIDPAKDPVQQHDRLSDRYLTDADGERFESIRGDRLLKITGQTPRDVGQLRDRFDHYEADILFPNRLLIDRDIRSGVRVPTRRDDEDGPIDVHHAELEPVAMDVAPRVCTFDIEVDDRRGFPEDGEEPIVCLTSHDSYDDEYIVWLYTAPDGIEGPADLPGYDPISGDLDADVRAFEREEALLSSFVDYIRATDPDVLTGWNFTDFDAPYLLDRIEELATPENGLAIDPLSRVNEVWRSDWQGPNVKGRVVFDLLYAYKRTQFTELDSYRLDAVGETELDVGKERYPGDIGDLWEDDPERLLEYNLRDVELCVELDRKQEIVPFWQEVASFVGCKLEDATTPGDAVDMYILHEVHGDLVLPSKGTVDAEDYEGGAVFDPITGVKENVSVLDLASLYPMSMVTINASPETKVGDDYEGDTYRAPNGTEFRAEPDGIIRTMVDDLLTEREEKKGLRNDHDPGTDAYEQYDRQQQAVKVIMNSLYGVLGWDRFRLYDKEMGAAVTATGRDVIRYTEKVVSKMDYQIVYGDSVTGERPIVVRDPDGNVRIRPIEALFDAADPAPGHETVITADGGEVASVSAGKEAGKLEGWEALSVADAETAEWQPIQRVIRHETDKPVTKLQHKFGESTTTSDHSYVTLGEDRELRETVPEEVDEPLRVPEFPPVSDVEQIDVYEILDGYERVYEGGRGTGGTTTKTKRVHANESHVWFGHEHYDQLDSTVMVKRYIEPGTEDSAALLRLLAAYITEESATTVETAENKFGASIAESRREWLEGLQTDYERLFENATVSVIASDSKDKRSTSYSTDSGTEQTTYNDRTQKVQMMNELSAVFFREFAGQTSRGKRLPSFVFNLSDEEQELFLDTLIEGDGSREFPRYTDEYAEQNFDFETTSRELAAGLSMLLTQRERKHSLKYRDAKGSYTIRTCESYRSGRDPVLTEVEHDGYVYDLSVTENDNFVDAVGGIALHNTDSVMLELGPDVSTEAAIEQSFEIEERVNESYDEFAREQLDAEEHRFQIEFEKLYRRFFQAGKKKRYAGNIVWKEGKEVDDIDITGFEYKRSDIAPVTKRVQHRVIEMIVTGADLDDVRTYVHDEIESFKEGDADLDDIGIPGGIGQKLDSYDTATAQVRGAKYANLLLGTNFGRGSKPKRLYLENVDAAFFERMEAEEGLDPHADPLYGEFKRDPDVICFEYADQVPDEFHVDYEKMLEKTLKGPIARILEAMDVSWQEAESGQEQTGLGSFM